MKRKTLLSLLFSVYAGVAMAQNSIDLSEIGAQAAQDCAENADCLVQDSIANIAPSDLSAFESGNTFAGTAGEFAAAAAGLGGAYFAVRSGGSNSADGATGAATRSGVEQVQEFGTQENGGFNVANDTDTSRMDDELLLLSLNQPQETVQTSCEDETNNAIDTNLGEYCDCFDNRCYECNYAEPSSLGSDPVACVAFSYTKTRRPNVNSADDVDRGHYE